MSGSTVSYVYKASGELASTAAGGVSCSTYVYDDFGRTASQTQVKSAACGTRDRVTVGYVYDGLDRVQRTTTGGSAEARTRFSYDGLSSALVGQKDAVNGADTDPTVLYQLNVDGSPTALAQFTAPGAGSPARSWLDKDGSGNVTTLLGSGDSSASCVVDYDPFGSPIGVGEDRADDPNAVCATGSAKESTGNAVWYRSAVRDASYGTYQFGARTYDPSLGAFTTPDSRRVDTPADDLSVGTDPLTLNGYAYVNGNPVNLADLDGHRPAYVGGTDSLVESAAVVRDEHDAAIAAAYTPVNKSHVLPPAVESQAAGSGSILHRIWSGVESKFNSVVGVSVGTAQQQIGGGVLLFAADVGDDAWDYLIHDQVAKAGVDFPELDLHGRLAKLLNQAGIRTDTLYSVIGEYGPLFIAGPEGAERAAGAANDALRALEETVGRGSRVATKDSGELGTRLAAARSVDTPYGPALQSDTAAAQAARADVAGVRGSIVRAR